MSVRHRTQRLQAQGLAHRGFTLIEVMIVVAIIAILSAIAIPSYRDYVLRGQIADATTGLSAMRADMERYFQDNRTYLAVGAFTPPCAAPGRVVGKFTITCPAADLTNISYTLLATGSGSTLGFDFTLTQQGVQGTANIPPASGWGTSPATCWVLKRGQTC